MVTAHNVTTKRDIVNPLCYIGEGDAVTTPSNYGTTPTSPTYVIVGNTTEINPQPDIQHVDVMHLGSEDIVDAVKTGSLYAFNFKYLPINNTLAKYATQAAGGGTGSIDESLSFAWSEKIDGTTYYNLVKGFVPTSITGTLARGVWEYDITGVAKDIVPPNSTDQTPGTPTYPSETSTSPMSHSDGGASPFTWNSNTYGERRFSFTVTRDLAVVAVNGENDIIYAKAAGRTISFSAEVFMGTYTTDVNELHTDWEAKTARTATYEIGSSDTITFTNSVLTSWARTPAAGNTDAFIESITARAESCSIA